MTSEAQIHEFLLTHLNSINQNDIEAYHSSTHEDLTLYEWWVTPHRLEGLPFHDFMMAEAARRGTVFGTDDGESDEETNTRFDLSNLKIQTFDNCAIVSYTLLISTGSSQGVKVASHNETRVMVKIEGEWKVVHVHKSPAWQAPHMPEKP
jgi:ketosteroid isomerase-like protein